MPDNHHETVFTANRTAYRKHIRESTAWSRVTTLRVAVSDEQTSVEDKEASHVVSAINCYFMCEVRLPVTSKTAKAGECIMWTEVEVCRTIDLLARLYST